MNNNILVLKSSIRLNNVLALKESFWKKRRSKCYMIRGQWP